MKVTIATKKAKAMFPTVRKVNDKDEDIVVLFTDLTSGIVLHSSKGTYTIGSVNQFVRCTDSNVWQPCSITLES